jgi:probable DNA metabolism protein
MKDKERALENRVFFYRLHKAYNPKIESVVRYQADAYGVSYVISTVSKESRELYKKSRQVSSEIHRYISFMRLIRSGDKLVGKAEFEHNTEELVLAHFKKRFPQKKIVLLSGAYAFVTECGGIKKESAMGYLKLFEKEYRGDDSIWQTFYDSQYIEARRNRKLALRCIPKKLWKSLSISEAYKLDRGIEGMNLTDFI